MMPAWVMGPIRVALIAAAAAAAGAAAGYAFEHRARTAEVAAIRAEIASREAAAADAARRRIETAARAADAAIAARDERIAALEATTRRLRHEIKSATIGRPCLSADARRLLHQSTAFGPGVPASAAHAAPAAAAPAADPGDRADSTDAGVAQWIADVAELYERCRARLDAIRQWDEVTHGGG